MKNFKTGLVVGKFCPLHKGHILTLSKANEECEKLIIISYTSEYNDLYPPALRRAWLKTYYPDATIIVLDPKVNRIPKDSDSAEVHREFCFQKVKGTKIDAVYSSEDYGHGFAQYIQNAQGAPCSHRMVDQERNVFPISGTQLRTNMNYDDLPYFVARSLVKKVVFLGGESSGKTTLTKAMAEKFHSLWVPEYGRQLYDEKNGQLVFDDMMTIVDEQLKKEESQIDFSVHYGNEFLFCDTSPLTTMFYSLELFGMVDGRIHSHASKIRLYDKIYVCAPDFPFVQDGTRQDDEFRYKGHDWYINYLNTRKIDFSIVMGSLQERIEYVTNDLLKG